MKQRDENLCKYCVECVKPCPFCGSDEVIYMKYQHDAGTRWKIFCCGCAAGIDPGWAQTKHALTGMWNKRVIEKGVTA